MVNTCTHTYDNGHTCNSVVATGRDYCVYHLRHRARLLRMAQARARSERFDLKLPPLESMHAVQSALTRLVEAVAADMIDLKRADFLLKALRFAAQSLKWADKWPAPVFHSGQAVSLDVAAEFGLPQDLDLDTPPEVAFPSPPGPDFSDLSSRAQAAASPAALEEPVLLDTAPGSPFAAQENDLDFRPDFPISPENVEVCEIYATQGPDAAQVRCDQLERNRQRRELRADRKRFAGIALRRNIRVAAQKLADRKLAEQHAPQKVAANPPDVGCPIPPAVGGVGIFPDAAKKTPAFADAGIDEYLAGKEATTA